MNIIHQPYENLFIYQLIKDDLDIFKRDVINSPNVYLVWVNGFIIIFHTEDKTEYVQRLRKEDKTVIWAYLNYAEMPKFLSSIENRENGMKACVADVSNDPFWIEVSNFLKSL